MISTVWLETENMWNHKKLALKYSWNNNKWIYFQRILVIWNHCVTSYRQVQVVSSILSTYMPDIWKLNANKSTQTHFPAQAVATASQPALARRLLLLLTAGVAEPLGKLRYLQTFFWPRFYIVVLGMIFFFISTNSFFPIFKCDELATHF